MHSLCCMSSVQLETRPPSRVRASETHHRMSLAVESNAAPAKVQKAGPPVKLSPAAAISPPQISNQHQTHHSMAELNLDSDDGKSPLGTSSRPKPVDTSTGLKISGVPGEVLDTADARLVPSSGTNVAGILYKWVNYGKGWKRRWFVLQEGVLGYYKVHGPDKVSVNHERHKGLRLIGDEAQRLMKKQKQGHVDEKRPMKAFGEVHLKVSSLRESKSDDKKFYIYSGTKTLHLRAETKEDRSAWMDALHSAKDLFSPSSAIFAMPPHDEVVISTDKLRARLLEEGLSEDVVKDCEKIMLNEFSAVDDLLKVLQANRFVLTERVRQLEAEKVELETTVVDEMQNQAYEAQNARVPGLGKCQGTSETESDDENEKAGIADAETDEDDDVFFDTRESLVSDSFRGSSATLRSVSSEWGGEGSDGLYSPGPKGREVGMDLVGFDYPAVRRRTKLPDPKEKEKGVSLWSMIKDNIGKDLTKVCLPVYFNEPLSSLQRCFEDLEYSFLLDRAYEWGKRGNGLLRILNVAAFAVSGYASTEARTCKPFNPLLGETYEASYQDKGLRFFSEKVSHHPMVVACHCEGRGWKFWGDSTLKSKFWGRSIQLDPVGTLTLEFSDGEVFQWSKVTTSIYNLILGKLYCDHYGTMRIQGNRDYSCKLKFKEQSLIDRNPHQVQGYVHDKTGERAATLIGKWDEGMSYVIGDLATRPKNYDPMTEAETLWRKNPPPENPTRYGLTAFAITLNELTNGLKEKLPPTDSRLRPDQRHLENGEYEEAFAEKLRLEQRQRQARKLQETGWQPQWFRKDNEKDQYLYRGGYWEARKQRQWTNCPDIFGPNLPDVSAAPVAAG